MSKPLFTTKHYKAIAELFKELETINYNEDIVLEDVIELFQEKFKEDNQNFSKSKFRKAI